MPGPNTLATSDPQVRFARERRRYEQVIMSRLGTTLTWEDAEDIVSDAIIDLAAQCPPDAQNEGRNWFSRVVVNRAHDYRRARDGRPRSARGAVRDPNAASQSRRFLPLDEIDLDSAWHQTAGGVSAGMGAPVAELEAAEVRREARQVVMTALAKMDPYDADLVVRRNLSGENVTRASLAEDLGMPVSRLDVRYSAAWRSFTDAIASEKPSSQCEQIRRALEGDAVAGPGSSSVSIHLDSCTSCRLHGQRRLRLRPRAIAA